METHSFDFGKVSDQLQWGGMELEKGREKIRGLAASVGEKEEISLSEENSEREAEGDESTPYLRTVIRRIGAFFHRNPEGGILEVLEGEGVGGPSYRSPNEVMGESHPREPESAQRPPEIVPAENLSPTRILNNPAPEQWERGAEVEVHGGMRSVGSQTPSVTSPSTVGEDLPFLTPEGSFSHQQEEILSPESSFSSQDEEGD